KDSWVIISIRVYLAFAILLLGVSSQEGRKSFQAEVDFTNSSGFTFFILNTTLFTSFFAA
ncbi:unnamed protein product, partial [Brassica oleracea var. botrytis]